MATPVKVLIIEDSPEEASLLIRELEQAGYAPLCERVQTAETMRSSLRERNWDVIVSGYNIPGFNGLDALTVLKETGIDIPFLIVSGTISSEEAVEAMRKGARDYIGKDRRDRLIPAIERELAEAAIRREHRALEAALRESEEKFRLLIESAPDAAFVHVRGHFAYVNPAAVSLFRAESSGSLLRCSVLDRLHPDYREIARERIRLSIDEKKAVQTMEQRYLRMDGSILDVEVSAVPVTYENDSGGLVFVRDIGARKQAERERHQSQQIAERLAEEMAVMAEIGRVIGATLDIDEVYERFAAEARKLIPAERIIVNLNSPEGDKGIVTYSSGLEVPSKRVGAWFPMAGSVNELLIRERACLLIQPASEEELAARFPRLVPNYVAGIRSMLCVPLISRDEVIGVLHFHSIKTNAYDTENIPMAERIAGQISGAIANARLFTDLKGTEASLRESETRFRAIFDQAAVGVAEVDLATGRFITVNRRLCELAGRTEAEMLAATFLTITHPDDRHVHEENIALLVAGKIGNFTIEKRYLRRDGTSLWASLTISPLWKPGEEPGRYLIVVQDVTEGKRMHEEIERRSKQLAALYETSLELTAELNLSSLLDSLTRRALKLIGGATCNCYLYNQDTDLLERAVSAGQGLISVKATRQRGEGVVGTVWATGEPLLVNDYHAWPGRITAFASTAPSSMIGAPIRRGGEFLGVLNISGTVPNQFTRADIEILGMFATQAAIAIRNARLYNRTEQTAITDELTGLFNRRGLLQLGEREFDRARRFDRPLAAVMVDIDLFKTVNDRYGHLNGDEVLRDLADCFRQNTRGIDVVGRYGGEEFILLLPETLLPTAVQIAERLRQSIFSRAIPISRMSGECRTADIRITVSVGVAVVTQDVQSLAVLIDRADQALYRAKHSGRNCVAEWRETEKGMNPEAPRSSVFVAE